MKTIFNRIVNIFIVSVALSSCASAQSNQADVNIEKDTSSRYRISNIQVTKDNSIVTVAGTLHSQTRSRFPGHVDITFYSISGEVLHIARVDYRRRSLKSRNRMFRVKIPLELPDGSSVHIVHHRRDHNENG